MSAELPESTLRDFYVGQRDAHLKQFMAINGRAVLSVVTLSFSVLVGFDKVRTVYAQNWPLWVAYGLLLLGAVFLTVGAGFMSNFHTSKIVSLEKKISTPTPIAPGDSVILPPYGPLYKYPNLYFFVGSMAIVASMAILLLYKFALIP